MKLNAKHLRAIELTLKGITPKTICTELDIAPRTLRYWKTQTEYKFEYEMMFDELQGRIFQKMLSLHELAHRELLDILMSNNKRDKIKVLPLCYQNIFNANKELANNELLNRLKCVQEKLDELPEDETTP
jgi:orotate phosphoribosyltransferase-like protein